MSVMLRTVYIYCQNFRIYSLQKKSYLIDEAIAFK
jgi:hypothetical protein